MNAIEHQLLDLKDAALQATRDHDGEFYAGYLRDDAVAITPYGVFGKEAVVAQMSSPASSFASMGVDDVRAGALSDTTGYVTYRAHYPTGDVMVSTVYVRDDDGWKGVLYQQTPVP